MEQTEGTQASAITERKEQITRNREQTNTATGATITRLLSLSSHIPILRTRPSRTTQQTIIPRIPDVPHATLQAGYTTALLPGRLLPRGQTVHTALPVTGSEEVRT